MVEEEWRRVEVVAAEAWWIAKEKMATARQKAVIDAEAKCKAKVEVMMEEMEVEQGGGSPLKQKG